ncbi:hypothetical protein [Paraburkholderia kururiensis]|uniref:Uncharacterized protein n=1 Tax=Paraburkholderia kururiensis TaxID=984307 RepID=A0ABZ0WMZ2_9BURK|nr:hypothetical protein [Paraburkholderia kururiensis]WQD78640.1 hypothetical protein U0042_02730 [Paraburkholderia kururiensis]
MLSLLLVFAIFARAIRECLLMAFQTMSIAGSMKSSGYKNSNADFSLNGESVDMFRVLFLRGNFYARQLAGRFALPCAEWIGSSWQIRAMGFSGRIAISIATLIESGGGALARMSGAPTRSAALRRRRDPGMSLRP